MTYGERVKYVRKRMGLTQKQLAKALGVSFATINRWENNQNSPSSLARKVFDDYCDGNLIEFPFRFRDV